MPELSICRQAEAEIIRAVVDSAHGDPLERRKWNVEGTLEAPSADHFWKWLVLSLLSSQQPYREGSPTWRLEIGTDEFPVPLSGFGSLDEAEINGKLKRFRFHQRITKQLRRNHKWLFSEQGWEHLLPPIERLLHQRNSAPVPEHKRYERTVANMLVNKLDGVGPKQARNLLQSLGLTRYEIPLDSRVARFLQERLGWNICIEALARGEYYEDLLDRVQASCEIAGVLPALFDAAVFDELGRATAMKTSPSTCTGYVNRNGQVVVRNTRAPGTDNNQYVYQLACSHCGHVYGANGSDIHERLCPTCQSGVAGLPYRG